MEPKGNGEQNPQPRSLCRFPGTVTSGVHFPYHKLGTVAAEFNNDACLLSKENRDS